MAVGVVHHMHTDCMRRQGLLRAPTSAHKLLETHPAYTTGYVLPRLGQQPVPNAVPLLPAHPRHCSTHFALFEEVVVAKRGSTAKQAVQRKLFWVIDWFSSTLPGGPLSDV